MTVVIATTVAPYKATAGEVTDWLDNAEGYVESLKRFDMDVEFFCAVEVDNRGLDVYDDLRSRLAHIEGGVAHTEIWQFQLMTDDEKVDGGNRFYRICTGRNLCHEYAVRDQSVSHLMFFDSDLTIPGDAPGKLIEMRSPIVGGNVGAYCLSGPRDQARVWPMEWDVQLHMNTAGFLCLERQVFRKLRWRWDPDAGMTDDPCFNQDAIEAGFGPTKVRHDLMGLTRGPMINVDARGYDMLLRQDP